MPRCNRRTARTHARTHAHTRSGPAGTALARSLAVASTDTATAPEPPLTGSRVCAAAGRIRTDARAARPRGSWPASLFGFCASSPFNFSPPAPSPLVHSRRPTLASPSARPLQGPRRLLRRPGTAGIQCTPLHARCAAAAAAVRPPVRPLTPPRYCCHGTLCSLFSSRRSGANPTRPVSTRAPCLCLTLPRYPCSFRMAARAALALPSAHLHCSRRARAQAHTPFHAPSPHPFGTFIISLTPSPALGKTFNLPCSRLWRALLSLPAP
jgi:hypothetical protein